MGQGGPVTGGARANLTIDTSQLAAARAAVQAFAAGSTASLNTVAPALNSVSQGLRVAIANAIQLSNARAAVQSFATGATAALNSVSVAAQGTSAQLNAAIAAAAKLSNLKYMAANTPAATFAAPAQGSGGGVANALGFGGGIGAAAGAVGISLGVAGVVQAGKAVIAAEALATAYDRQGVAAANLAGSQGKLNAMMQVYDKATGGVVDKASALQNVTKLMAVGFADDEQELNKFATAIRGISIAMGKSQDTVTQDLVLELFTQRGARLDQLGLQYDKVRARADELQAADASLTQQQAYQNAVLEQAIERFGGLATSAEGAATGMELAAKSWTDLQLAIGQASQGPLDALGTTLSAFIDVQTIRLRAWIQELDFYIKLLRQMGMAGPWLTSGERDFVASSGARDAQRRNRGGRQGAPDPDAEEKRQVKLDWAAGVQDVNRQLQADIISAETSYGQQRADTIRNYQKGVAREERDFARQRLRANIEHLDSIADVYKDQTRRESKAAADLARSQGQARADADESIAEARKDSAERLLELDKDYNKDREKAALDHRDKMMDAAGRLDAQAVYELQRNYARESKEAEEAHDEQKSELADALKERIADEEKALAKSTRLQNEAAARQLEEARAADEERVADMKADFAARKALEDEDRVIRKGDQAADHADALAAAAAAQAARIQQMKDDAEAERVQLAEEANAALKALGVKNKAYDDMIARREAHWEKMWDKFMGHIETSLTGKPPLTGDINEIPAYARGGRVGATGLAYLHKNEYVMPAPALGMAAGGMGGGRSVTIGSINPTIVLGDIGGYSREQIKAIVIEGMIEVLEQEAA